MRRALLLLAFVGPSLGAQQALSEFDRYKAEAILRDQLPCLGCHELNGNGGHSAPPLTTVAQRRSPAEIRAVIEDPQTVNHTSAMPKTPMSSTTRELIIRYLGGSEAPSTEPAALKRIARPAENVVRQPAENAVQLYQRFCSSCHGRNGSGDGPNARYLPVRPAIHNSAAAMSKRSDDALFDAISGGGIVMGKSPRMPAFGQTLTPAEIRGLVAYVRQLCSCSGPTWSTR